MRARRWGHWGGGEDATPLLHPTFDLYWRPPLSWAQGRGQGSANSICSKSTVESRAGGRQGGKGRTRRQQDRRREEGTGGEAPMTLGKVRSTRELQ